MAIINNASAAKSRSLTASILFSITPLKPNFEAKVSGSGWIEDPANAPAPNGE